MSGIDLGRRLKTASILIAIVWAASIFPGSWFIINLGKIHFIIWKGFPACVMLEYSNIMQKTLEFLSETNGV